MFIRTERLFLRPGWPEDLDDLLSALGDDAIRQTVAVADLPATPDAIRRYLDQPRDPLLPHFFMYLREESGPHLVGGIGLGAYRGEVEVGYWIAARFRGQGFALEALNAVVEQARTLGHRRLVAKHFADAERSIRVLQSAGFSDAGSTRLRYSAGRGGDAMARLFHIELDRGRHGPLAAAAAAIA